jgi:hypothetical protein
MLGQVIKSLHHLERKDNMRKSELEVWVLNTIGRVEDGQPNDDARIELKGERGGW